MNALRRGAGLVLLVALLQGCVPLPHTVHLRPTVDGLLLRGGAATPGVRVWLSVRALDADRCGHLGAEVPVGSDGHFHLEALSGTAWARALLVPPALKVQVTLLCLQEGTQAPRPLVLLVNHQDRAQRARVRCDLDQPPSPSAFNWPQACQHIEMSTHE